MPRALKRLVAASAFPGRWGRSAGFTLIETIVSLAIFAVIAGGVAQTIRQQVLLEQRIEHHLAALTEARSALEEVRMAAQLGQRGLRQFAPAGHGRLQPQGALASAGDVAIDAFVRQRSPGLYSAAVIVSWQEGSGHRSQVRLESLVRGRP